MEQPKIVSQYITDRRSFIVLFLSRDADETKEWIEEKNQALNTDNYGHDLASVQALQRKHEGFERDLAALGDKVKWNMPTCPQTHIPPQNTQCFL